MKVLQSNSEKLLVIDRAETRWLLGLTLIVFGLAVAIIPNWLSAQSTDWQLSLPTVLTGVLFFLPGIWMLITTKVVICEIDKSSGLIRIKQFTLKGRESAYFYISQIMNIELKEIASIYYYIYKVNFIMNGYKRISLTYHPSNDRAEMEVLGIQVARFLNVNTQFSKSYEPLNFIPPM